MPDSGDNSLQHHVERDHIAVAMTTDVHSCAPTSSSFNSDLLRAISPLLPLDEVALVLNISTMTVRRLVRAGALPVVYVSARRPRVRAADLARYIDSKLILY